MNREEYDKIRRVADNIEQELDVIKRAREDRLTKIRFIVTILRKFFK